MQIHEKCTRISGLNRNRECVQTEKMCRKKRTKSIFGVKKSRKNIPSRTD